MQRIFKVLLLLNFMMVQSTVICKATTMPFFTPFKHDQIPDCPPPYTKCLSLDNVVQKSTHMAFDTKIKLQNVQQQYLNTFVMLGKLLPNLNFGNIKSIASLDASVVSNFVGFIFPSNWYRWKESKHLLKSQQWSFYHFLSSQVRLGEISYFSIHLLNTYRYIFLHYLTYIDAALEYFHDHENPSVHSAEIHLIKVFRSETAQKEFEMQKELALQVPNLLTNIGFMIDENWDNTFIQKLSLPVNPNLEKISLPNYLQIAYDKSLMLKTNKELYEASKYNKKTLYFDWMDPNGSKDNSLGFGLPFRIKIVKSNQKQIKTQEEKILSSIQSQMRNIIDAYNIYTDYYVENAKGIREASILLEIIRGKILNQLVFSVQQLFLALGKAMIFDINKATIIHAMLYYNSYLNYMTLNGKYYEDLHVLIPHFKNKTPSPLE